MIQAEGANPLYTSMQQYDGERLEPVQANTRASAIRIGNPASWRKIVHVLRETGGHCEQVTEQEIAIAKAEIGAEGIGCEPASAVTLAGLKKLRAQGLVKRDETVVLLLTGHTLKDSEYTIDFHRGTLLNDAETAALSEAERDAIRQLSKPPMLLDAAADAVLGQMEATVHG